MDLSLFESAILKRKLRLAKKSFLRFEKLEKYSTEDEQLLSGQKSPQT